MADAPTADAPATDAPMTDAPSDAPAADRPLGAEGEKALEAFKERAREAERDARAAKAELEKLRLQSMDANERAIAEAKAAGKTEALSVANERLVAAAARAVAAGKLANPSLAPRLIDLSQFKVDDDGNVDEEPIAKAIDRLLKAEPYLAAGASAPGSFDPGPRGGGASGPDMNAQIRRAAGRA